MKSQYDVVIVGAGPAGLSAAYLLAKAGVDVVVFERGEYPGAKNMFGGILPLGTLYDLLPGLPREAPVERRIVLQNLCALSRDASITVTHKDDAVGDPAHQCWSVLRSRFDRWLAQQSSAAGALIVPSTVVDDVLWEGDQVVGVRVRRPVGALRAHVVIAADGVCSVLARRAGLRPEQKAEDLALGIKEVLSLPAGEIERRLCLNPREGAAFTYIGSPTDGMQGAGFLYTNVDSLSVGVVARLGPLANSNHKITSFLDRLKSHPCVHAYISDSNLLEYSAHLIPEPAPHHVPTLCRGGMLLVGDAASFVVSTGLSAEGVVYAVASGAHAAATVLHATSVGRFDRRTLGVYGELVSGSRITRDISTFRRSPEALMNPRLYSAYPDLAVDVLGRILAPYGGQKQRLLSILVDAIRTHVSFADMARDMLQWMTRL